METDDMILKERIGHKIVGIEREPIKVDGKETDDDSAIIFGFDDGKRIRFRARFDSYTGESEDEYPTRIEVVVLPKLEHLSDKVAN
ncbi:MAG: hypothetical protein M1284_01140 [Candidatus Parvarchaeota archaeon]|nr:hypothetical protein [Candidatus Parvarchaeota archaeon]MCL5420339.1 hypothetical protein [Candidatus Parvarchaeota archaeon]